MKKNKINDVSNKLTAAQKFMATFAAAATFIVVASCADPDNRCEITDQDYCLNGTTPAMISSVPG